MCVQAEDEARVRRDLRQLQQRHEAEERGEPAPPSVPPKQPPQPQEESAAAARAVAAAQWVAGAAGPPPGMPSTQLAMYDAAAAATASAVQPVPGFNPGPGRNLGVPHLLQSAGPVGGDMAFPMGGAPLALQERLRAPSALGALTDLRAELVAEHAAITRALGGATAAEHARGFANAMMREDVTILPELFVPGVHAALPWEGDRNGGGGVRGALTGRRAEKEAEMPGVHSTLLVPTGGEGGMGGAALSNGVGLGADALERWFNEFERIDKRAKNDMYAAFARA